MKVRNFDDLAEPIKADPRRRANIERHRQEALQELIAYELQEVRRARGITQVELARLLGTNQPNVSRMERVGDPHLSSLRAYVEALGGHLELAAVFDDERFVVASDDAGDTVSPSTAQ